ncbi:hypothetical protein H1V43_32700 [Streptomyces sp. PSKA54]|uniref:Uncharacterized protein n=1 Tax=Streptomyces himalayensis subsp. aureolus TaxID=2758039 RepID=A0A7W2HJD3_9ACTN|nr:hypothetical protein [Streptomyces himalayensis]MBA4866012.1 hypothetical protein [Streptomyces himalayensis subsp. aureolus]
MPDYGGAWRAAGHSPPVDDASARRVRAEAGSDKRSAPATVRAGAGAAGVG